MPVCCGAQEGSAGCCWQAREEQACSLTCEYTATTRRGQPKALVALKVTSMGKFHTTDVSPPLLLRATWEKPSSMPCTTRQSGP